MNRNARLSLSWPVVAAAVIALLAVGAGGTYLWLRGSSGSGQRTQDTASPAHTSSTGTTPQSTAADNSPSNRPPLPLPDVVVTLSPDTMKRAGIGLVAVTRGFLAIRRRQIAVHREWMIRRGDYTHGLPDGGTRAYARCHRRVVDQPDMSRVFGDPSKHFIRSCK